MCVLSWGGCCMHTVWYVSVRVVFVRVSEVVYLSCLTHPHFQRDVHHGNNSASTNSCTCYTKAESDGQSPT